MTTVSVLGAALQAVTALRAYSWDVTSLQEHEQRLEALLRADEPEAVRA
jgi:carbamoyl-phosphate synthase large subunit